MPHAHGDAKNPDMIQGILPNSGPPGDPGGEHALLVDLEHLHEGILPFLSSAWAEDLYGFGSCLCGCDPATG